MSTGKARKPGGGAAKPPKKSGKTAKAGKATSPATEGSPAPEADVVELPGAGATALDVPPTEAPPSEESPEPQEQPADEKPAAPGDDDRSDFEEDRPTATAKGEPADDKPVDGESADDKPADESADDKPAENAAAASARLHPPPVGEPATATGRSRLKAAMWPRLSVGQLLAGLLCGLLGFAAVVQARSNADAPLASLRTSDLPRVLGEMSERLVRVDAERRELEEIRNRQLAGDGEQAAQQDVRRQIDRLAILAGVAPATGPGVEITIDDPSGQVQADQLLDTVQELRGAGAESISVGDARVVASTAFVDGPQGVLVDGRLVTRPYLIRAIGDPRSLATALDIPGGVTEVLRQQYAAGATVQQRERLRIDAVREPGERSYAEPVPG